MKPEKLHNLGGEKQERERNNVEGVCANSDNEQALNWDILKFIEIANQRHLKINKLLKEHCLENKD